MADALEDTFLATLADFSRITGPESSPAAETKSAPHFADVEELLERTTGFEPATPTLAKHAPSYDQLVPLRRA